MTSRKKALEEYIEYKVKTIEAQREFTEACSRFAVVVYAQDGMKEMPARQEIHDRLDVLLDLKLNMVKNLITLGLKPDSKR